MDGIVPKLKHCVWTRTNDTLVVLVHPHQATTLADPNGQVEALLTMLRAGDRSVGQLHAAIAQQFPEVTRDELDAAVSSLDELGFLEDVAGSQPTEAVGRFASSLAFFDYFSRLHLGRNELQRRLVDSHVLVLGTGGLGSTVVMNLAGLGVGRLTLLDVDTVEPRNFARQFLYRAADIGRSKVERAAEWVQEFDPAIEVRAIERRIAGPRDIADLLPGVHLVIRGVDQPPREIAGWVNEACTQAGVPHIGGGLFGTRLMYYSVDPDVSACQHCAELAANEEDAARDYSMAELRQRLAPPNNGIGPFASLLGSLVAMEALRYLTRFAPPVTAGAVYELDVTGGGSPSLTAWARRANCPVCTSAC
ncbi:ThiF family adenylyltransferase [Micromonospora sp. WMMD1102]|uniref:HesA/MoeB/ThiF family protein n=1 Tax=Micromonospora sp. WMMD1102 TaxID=3016105 RepID=UPI002415814B|nr:ThiF family adenylyltransferase [Micromonospora sp. WMMD1102]MDG4785979.1 ThiF family adenylyltransferase [Micromonospora sp. WMMD1102]